jgi:hypothetical protein
MTDGKTTILPGTYLEVTSRIHGPAGLLRPSVAAILGERKADEGISPVEVPPQVPTCRLASTGPSCGMATRISQSWHSSTQRLNMASVCRVPGTATSTST